MPRLSVNISETTAQEIRDLMDSRGTSATNIIRRAVYTYDYLNGKQDKGNTIQLSEKSSCGCTTVTELRLL